MRCALYTRAGSLLNAGCRRGTASSSIPHRRSRFAFYPLPAPPNLIQRAPPRCRRVCATQLQTRINNTRLAMRAGPHYCARSPHREWVHHILKAGGIDRERTRPDGKRWEEAGPPGGLARSQQAPIDLLRCAAKEGHHASRGRRSCACTLHQEAGSLSSRGSRVQQVALRCRTAVCWCLPRGRPVLLGVKGRRAAGWAGRVLRVPRVAGFCHHAITIAWQARTLSYVCAPMQATLPPRRCMERTPDCLDEAGLEELFQSWTAGTDDGRAPAVHACVFIQFTSAL